MRGERSEIRTLIHRSERYIILIALPPIVMFFTLPDRVILILSGKFAAAAPMLQILSLWAVIAIINTPYRNLIQGFDRPGIMAKVSILQGSINVLLNLVFIPAALFGIPLFGWSAVGAALATLITQMILFVIVRWYAYRLSGCVSSPKNALLVLGGVAMGATLLALDHILPASRWYLLAAYGLIGLGAYLGTLVAVRQFTRKDLDFFLQAVHPAEMVSYIKGEITTRGAVDEDDTETEGKPPEASSKDTGKRTGKAGAGRKDTVRRRKPRQ